MDLCGMYLCRGYLTELKSLYKLFYICLFSNDSNAFNQGTNVL